MSGESGAPAARGRLAAAFAVVGPMVLAVVTGLPCLDGAFVRDDRVYVVENPLVTGGASPGAVFSSPFDPARDLGLYRPLSLLTFVWNWGASGGSPRAFHATNLALAAAAAGLLAALLLLWRIGSLWAALGAALFAAHPARSEAVFWISARSELLMTAFSLLALVLAQGLRGAVRWPLVALAAVAAAFSKEQGFVLVLLVPLLPGLARRERIAGLAWTAGALCAAFAWRAHVVGAIGPRGALQVLPGATAAELAAVGLHHLGRYARLLVWPHPLVNEYDDPVMPPGAPWIAVGAVAALAAPVLLLAGRRRAAFAAALFLVPLLPVLNVFYRTGEIFAERFLCLPLAGFAALVALAFSNLPPRLRAVSASVLGAAVLVCGAATFDRARDWRSQRELAAAQLRDAPHLGASWHLVAADLMDAFRTREPEPEDVAAASAYLARAVALAPHRAGAGLMLAKVHLRQAGGMPKEDPRREAALLDAEKLLRLAIHAQPDLPQAHGALGLALVMLGRRDEAERELREELRQRPDELRAAVNLAQLLEESGRSAEAAEWRARVVEGARKGKGR